MLFFLQNSTIQAEWSQTRVIVYNRALGSTLFIRNRHTYCYDKLMKCTFCTFKIKTVIKELELQVLKNFLDNECVCFRKWEKCYYMFIVQSIKGWISYYATFFLPYMVSASLMGSYKANSVFKFLNTLLYIYIYIRVFKT